MMLLLLVMTHIVVEGNDRQSIELLVYRLQHSSSSNTCALLSRTVAVRVPVVRSVAGGRTLHVDPRHGRLPRCVPLAYSSKLFVTLLGLSSLVLLCCVAEPMRDVAVSPKQQVCVSMLNSSHKPGLCCAQ